MLVDAAAATTGGLVVEAAGCASGIAGRDEEVCAGAVASARTLLPSWRGARKAGCPA